MIILNLSTAVHVHRFGEDGIERPGARLDVQRECIAQHPALEAFVVEPASPIHDCGPNGVRMFAATLEELQEAAPPSGSPWDIWLEVPEEQPLSD